jgi:hypothetical protein
LSSVDVIVPCYRYGRFLLECVQSVLTQSLPDIRVLIIDDASPDNTPQIAAKLAAEDSRVHVIRHSSNKGHIATYNEGIEWASADYMLILSADDYLLGGALKRVTDLMDVHPEVGFSFGNAIEIDQTGRSLFTNSVECKDDVRILSGLEFIQLSGPRNIVPTPTAIVRTDLQKQVGGYSSELPHAGDMEMWLRLAAHASVGFIVASQAVYRRHANNMSLAYTDRGLLPDFEQRLMAFECFFRTCSHLLPDAKQLRYSSLFALAHCAVIAASTAMNQAKPDFSEQLSEFALGIHPGIKSSMAWMKLACKQRIGSRAWRSLHLWIQRIRETVPR